MAKAKAKKKLWVQGLYCVHSKGVLASASFAPRMHQECFAVCDERTPGPGLDRSYKLKSSYSHARSSVTAGQIEINRPLIYTLNS